MTGDVQHLSRSGREGGEEGGCGERFGERGAGGGRLREMEVLLVWHRDGDCHWMRNSSQCGFHSQELQERGRGGREREGGRGGREGGKERRERGEVGGRCGMGTHNTKCLVQ